MHPHHAAVGGNRTRPQPQSIQPLLAARREQAEFEKRERERAERIEAQRAQWLMESRQPRTINEILTIARMMP
jgi:hypothetical protein